MAASSRDIQILNEVWDRLVQQAGYRPTPTLSSIITDEAAAGGGSITLAAVGSAPSANGATVAGSVLTLQPADATHPGLLTNDAQIISGAKTFSSVLTSSVASGAQAFAAATGARWKIGSGTTDYFESDGTTRIRAAGNLECASTIFANAFKGGGSSGAPGGYTANIGFPSDISGVTNLQAMMTVYPRAAVDAGDLLFAIADHAITQQFTVSVGGAVVAQSLGTFCAGGSLPGVFENNAIYTSGNGRFNVYGNQNDGAAAVGVNLDTLKTLSTDGALLVTVRNNGSLRRSIDINGKDIYADYVDISGTPGNGTANAVTGRATIASGAQTCVVSDTRVTANSIIMIQMETAAGGVGNVVVTGKVAGTSFTVTSVNGTGAATNTTANVTFSFWIIN